MESCLSTEFLHISTAREVHNVHNLTGCFLFFAQKRSRTAPDNLVLKQRLERWTPTM